MYTSAAALSVQDLEQHLWDHSHTQSAGDPEKFQLRGILIPFHHLLVTKEIYVPFCMYSAIKLHDKIATSLANSSECSEVKAL